MRAIVLFLRDISQRPLDLFLMGLLIAGYLGASELVYHAAVVMGMLMVLGMLNQVVVNFNTASKAAIELADVIDTIHMESAAAEACRNVCPDPRVAAAFDVAASADSDVEVSDAQAAASQGQLAHLEAAAGKGDGVAEKQVAGTDFARVVSARAEAVAAAIDAPAVHADRQYNMPPAGQQAHFPARTTA